MADDEIDKFRSSLSKLITDSNFKDSGNSELESRVLRSVQDFEFGLGRNKFEKLAKSYADDSNFFNHAFSSYLTAVTKEMNKYKRYDGDENGYKLILSQASLKMLERELYRSNYNTGSSMKSLDYSRKFGKKYLYKTALKSLENENFVQKVKVGHYLLLLSIAMVASLPLIKEGLRTPSVYAAELVGSTDILLALSGGLLAYFIGYENGKRSK